MRIHLRASMVARLQSSLILENLKREHGRMIESHEAPVRSHLSALPLPHPPPRDLSPMPSRKLLSVTNSVILFLLSRACRALFVTTLSSRRHVVPLTRPMASLILPLFHRRPIFHRGADSAVPKTRDLPFFPPRQPLKSVVNHAGTLRRRYKRLKNDTYLFFFFFF